MLYKECTNESSGYCSVCSGGSEAAAAVLTVDAPSFMRVTTSVEIFGKYGNAERVGIVEVSVNLVVLIFSWGQLT